jgi:hypothetical protein
MVGSLRSVGAIPRQWHPQSRRCRPEIQQQQARFPGSVGKRQAVVRRFDPHSSLSSDLKTIAERDLWEQQPSRTVGVARATYLHLPSGAKLWNSKKEFENADPDLLNDPAGLYWSEGHNVDCYSSRRQFYSRTPRVAFERVLTSAVRNLGWETVRPSRADIDDATPLSTSLDITSYKLGHQQNGGPSIHSE